MANYYMLGGDGKEYGPVSTEQLRQWLGEKRANARTQIRANKESAWVALGTVPEFNAPVGTPGAGASPGGGSTPGVSSPGFVPALAGDSTAMVKRLALELAAGGRWMRIMAITIFVLSGLFIYKTEGVGLLVAWLPIWFGLILNRAASRTKLAGSTGAEGDLLSVFAQLRGFVNLAGVLIIITLVVGILLMMMADSAMSNPQLDEMMKTINGQLGK